MLSVQGALLHRSGNVPVPPRPHLPPPRPRRRLLRLRCADWAAYISRRSSLPLCPAPRKSLTHLRATPGAAVSPLRAGPARTVSVRQQAAALEEVAAHLLSTVVALDAPPPAPPAPQVASPHNARFKKARGRATAPRV